MIAPANQRPDKEFMTIRIDTSLKSQLQQMAGADNRSLSSMVTMMLKSAVQKDQKIG